MVTEGVYATARHFVNSTDFRALHDGSAEYPRGFLMLPHPPPVLYVAGSLSVLDDGAVAIVGSRRASPTALAAASAVARGIAELGRTVVSGLARGVDAAAHRGALSVDGGRTVAVVATGLDRTFPAEHLDLDRSIRKHGAVVSTFPFGQPASRRSLLARNELIAALAVASVVIAAEERSGTRATIDHTVAQGKPVLFWEPLMGAAPWAQTLASNGDAYFVKDVADIFQRLPPKG